jgi:hypothetical protein
LLIFFVVRSSAFKHFGAFRRGTGATAHYSKDLRDARGEVQIFRGLRVLSLGKPAEQVGDPLVTSIGIFSGTFA